MSVPDQGSRHSLTRKRNDLWEQVTSRPEIRHITDVGGDIRPNNQRNGICMPINMEPATREEAERLVSKLGEFRSTLPDGEQRVLDATLLALDIRLKTPEVQDLLADFPDAAELLDDVAGFTHNPPTDEDNLIPTTVTVTTTATTSITSITGW